LKISGTVHPRRYRADRLFEEEHTIISTIETIRDITAFDKSFRYILPGNAGLRPDGNPLETGADHRSRRKNYYANRKGIEMFRINEGHLAGGGGIHGEWYGRMISNPGCQALPEILLSDAEICTVIFVLFTLSQPKKAHDNYAGKNGSRQASWERDWICRRWLVSGSQVFFDQWY
jgi:hypothetical protein